MRTGDCEKLFFSSWGEFCKIASVVSLVRSPIWLWCGGGDDDDHDYVNYDDYDDCNDNNDDEDYNHDDDDHMLRKVCGGPNHVPQLPDDCRLLLA